MRAIALVVAPLLFASCTRGVVSCGCDSSFDSFLLSLSAGEWWSDGVGGTILFRVQGREAVLVRSARDGSMELLRLEFAEPDLSGRMLFHVREPAHQVGELLFWLQLGDDPASVSSITLEYAELEQQWMDSFRCWLASV